MKFPLCPVHSLEISVVQETIDTSASADTGACWFHNRLVGLITASEGITKKFYYDFGK
jgi:hypothetical protein